MQNAGMIYGYARASTDAQDLTSQLAQLKAAGCENVFREKVTGTTAARETADTRRTRSEASAPPGTEAPQVKSAYSLTTASPPLGPTCRGMPSLQKLLGLVLRAAAMAALAGIIMRLFGIA
jgi:hypothetical protein